ncbi:MAG: ATP-NAD kinase-like domain-containing protein [Linnemannia gamsii]|nr:MAG: ATP-NAD kinase-like domain-containing protein [Linnemannia gamsii]
MSLHRSTIHSLREPFKALVSKNLSSPTASLHTRIPTPSLSLTGTRPSSRSDITPSLTGLHSRLSSGTRIRSQRVPSSANQLRAFSSTHACSNQKKSEYWDGGDLEQVLESIDDNKLGSKKGGSNAGSGGSHKLTSALPTKAKMTLDTPGVFPKDLAPTVDKEPSREIRQPFGTTYGGNYKLHWDEGPRTILIIKKPNDEQTDKALVDVASWIHTKYPHTNVVVEPDVAEAFAESLPFVYTIPEGKRVEYTRVTDLVITLGGDGTILHTSSLFNSAVPPVISFSMGTLGFLLPYHINNYQTALAKLIENRTASLLLRMRLKCTLHGPDGRRLQAKDGSGRINDLTVMNEVNLHRGRYPHLTSIGCFVDGHMITEAVADGLIIASPTGSTAYSLSAGGSIVHPSIQTLLLTPICPRSLSFRPVLLPPNATIQLKIGDKSRGPAEVSLDGKETFFLDKNEFLQVCMSPFPMPCVNRVHAGEDWMKDINDLLKWNQSFHNKQSMSHYISE